MIQKRVVLLFSHLIRCDFLIHAFALQLIFTFINVINLYTARLCTLIVSHQYAATSLPCCDMCRTPPLFQIGRQELRFLLLIVGVVFTTTMISMTAGQDISTLISIAINTLKAGSVSSVTKVNVM